MKNFKIVMVMVAMIMFLAPTNSLKAQNSLNNVVSALTSSNGSSAGSALLGLYTQFKADGKLDMTNANNISNLITLASNIKGLASTTNTSSFLSGLISGSKNLVNNVNSSSVLSSLSSLSKLDLSGLASSAASSVASGLLSKVMSKGSSSATASQSALTSQASSILTSLFGKLN